MELEQVLELFKFLASPYEDSSQKLDNNSIVISSPDAVFKNITEFLLNHVDFLDSSKTLLTSDNPTDTAITSQSSWKLTCLILSLLSKLKTAIEEAEAQQPDEEKSIDVLSIQSQILVQKSVELVIGFGVVPYLLPGLGVPPKLRKMNRSVSQFLSDVKIASPFHQFLRLAHTLEILLDCSKHPTLNTLIAQKYSSDVLAGLLQVCISPILRPISAVPDTTKPGALTLEQYEHVMIVRNKLSLLMTELFLKSVPKAVLIQSLLLVGSAEKPRWISASCNDMLGSIMLSNQGLIIISSTMLDVSGSCDTWKLMRVISSLMRTFLVKGDLPGDPKKLQNLAEQCFQMVVQNQEVGPVTSDKDKLNETSPDKQSTLKLPYGTNLDLIHIGLFCGLTLMDIDFNLGKALFWDKLFSPVVHLDSCQKLGVNISISLLDTDSSAKQDTISSRVRNVAVCAVYAELLLALLPPMTASLPLKRLQPVWSLLLQVFVACERYLKKAVQEPTVAAAAEQLHRKLKDVLLLLFEIYGAGAGESFGLPGSGTTPATGKREVVKENGNLCEFIMMLVLNQESNGVPALNTFELVCDEDDDTNVQLVRTHQEIISVASDYNEVYDKYLEQVCRCLAGEILKSERLKGLWPVLFRQLLAWGTKRQQDGNWKRKQKSFKSDQLPTRLDGDEVKVSLMECQKFITFKLLGELGDEEKILEQFGNSEEESMEETLGFLELLLNKFVDEVSSEGEDVFDASQLIMYALGIIGALIDAASASVEAMSSQLRSGGNCDGNPSPVLALSEINKELHKMWDNLEMFIPHLRKLSECSQARLVRQGVPEMASGLLLTIGTRGGDRISKTKSEFPLKTRFQQALEDAASPMVHVKGHGLLELRRLIEQKDRETGENGVRVVKIFQENLRNEDSYVYLMSIQGMAAVAGRFHKSVVPVLIKEYDFVNCNDDEDDDDGSGSTSQKMYEKLDRDERVETRMKVGEILVKVVQKLNELAPSYRVPLTNVCFRLMRDEEPLIRASALANLGELCHLLKFSLGVVLTEVWFCVDSILSTEKDLHVRRAALHLLVLLLKGVQNDLTAKDILSNTGLTQHLRDARRLLTRMEQSEGDLVAKTHCQLALQEMELIVKKLLTPNNTSSSLSYKIQILDL